MLDGSPPDWCPSHLSCLIESGPRRQDVSLKLAPEIRMFQGADLAHGCRQVAVAADGYGYRALCGRVQAQDHPHGGGLPGAVRAEEAWGTVTMPGRTEKDRSSRPWWSRSA